MELFHNIFLFMNLKKNDYIILNHLNLFFGSSYILGKQIFQELNQKNVSGLICYIFTAKLNK